MNTQLAPIFALLVGAIAGCQMQETTPVGARVAMTRDALPANCRELGNLVGKGGGLGGEYVPNEDLIEYAWSSIQNQAAEMGATHVRVDAPQLGSRGGTTSTATVTGTAYTCQKTPADALAAQNIEPVAPDPNACTEAAIPCPRAANERKRRSSRANENSEREASTLRRNCRRHDHVPGAVARIRKRTQELSKNGHLLPCLASRLEPPRPGKRGFPGPHSTRARPCRA